MLRFLTIWWGPLLIAFLAVNQALLCGVRWEFGPLGVPRSLVAANGWTYLDGSPIDPITLQLIRAGIEEEVYLAAIASIAVVVVLLIRALKQQEQARRSLAYWQEVNRRLARGERI